MQGDRGIWFAEMCSTVAVHHCTVIREEDFFLVIKTLCGLLCSLLLYSAWLYSVDQIN